LDRYSFDYKIVETDYHVFIVVDFDDQDIIFEKHTHLFGEE